MINFIRKWGQYIIAVAVLIVMALFYWYCRNMVCGYYELLWFRLIDDEGLTTKFFLIIPGGIFVGLLIYGIMANRRRKDR